MDTGKRIYTSCENIFFKAPVSYLYNQIIFTMAAMDRQYLIMRKQQELEQRLLLLDELKEKILLQKQLLREHQTRLKEQLLNCKEKYFTRRV